MTMHPDALGAIVLMAVVTYALRAGGYWMMGRVQLSARAEAAMAYLPGAVIASLVVPGVIEAGTPGVVGLAGVALVMWRWGNVMAGMVVGVALVWLVRHVL